MKEEMTYYDWLFKESDEEKEIYRLMDEERARYEGTETYKEHAAKLDELFEKLKVEGQKRRKEAEKHKPKRRAKAKHISEEEMAKFREQNRLEREARIDALPEPLRSIIRVMRPFRMRQRESLEKKLGSMSRITTITRTR